MDQSALYQALDLEGGVTDGDNLRYLQQIHPQFLCPTDPFRDELLPERFMFNSDTLISQADYAAVAGDYQNEGGSGELPPYGNVTCRTPARCMISNRGWSARFADVTDGLSNTFCLGECVGAMSHQQNWGLESWGTTAYPINWANDALMDPFPVPDGFPSPSMNISAGFRSFHPGGCYFL